MKKLILFLKSIYLFFFHLTPSGKKVKLYNEAYQNLKEAKAITELEKKQIQGEINFFLNSERRRRILTESQKILLVRDRFGKKLKNTGYKIDETTYKIVRA